MFECMKIQTDTRAPARWVTYYEGARVAIKVYIDHLDTQGK